jgi:hypothetical protein
MASQRNQWDTIGLLDLMKEQHRLRAVILHALRPRSPSCVPAPGSAEEQEDYDRMRKLERNRAASWALLEDDLPA